MVSRMKDEGRIAEVQFAIGDTADQMKRHFLNNVSVSALTLIYFMILIIIFFRHLAYSWMTKCK